MPLLFEQMLDFDGDVIRDCWELAMKFINQLHRVANAVKEVRIAERDVLGSCGNLAAHVFEHHIAADDSKDALVNRHNGAVPAQMLAAAARFRRANDAVAVAGYDEMRVFLNRGYPRTVRHFELQSR